MTKHRCIVFGQSAFFLLSTAAVVQSCDNSAHRPGSRTGGEMFSQARPAHWRIIDSASVGPWWNPMIDSGTVYSIRVQRGSDSIDVSDVIDPLPEVVADSTVLGLRLLAKNGDASREMFRVALPDRRMTMWPLPSDVYWNFADVSFAPDGRHIAYVADAGHGMTQAVVRSFPGDSVVIRGPRVGACECDVDDNAARWVSADSFEIAVVNGGAQTDTGSGWLLTAGRVSSARQHTVSLRTAPRWYEVMVH